MKAAFYYNNQDIRLEDIPKPPLEKGDLLIKTVSSGICGSDVMEWYRVPKAPVVLGHEVAGDVVQVDSEVSNFQEGDRVVVSHHVPCNECEYCRKNLHTACDTLRKTNFDPGGFCEFIRVPSANVLTGTFHLPDEISYDEGVFVEPLGCVLRSQRVANLGSEDKVLVIGAGISGLLHIKLALAKGCKRVFASDINEYRLQKAKDFGAEIVDSGTEIPNFLRENLEGKLADQVILCTGSPSALGSAIQCLDRGGVLQLFAPPPPGFIPEIDLNLVWKDQISLSTSYGAAPYDLEEAINLIEGRNLVVEDMITHKLPLVEIKEGFQLVSAAGDSLKVVIRP
ncbi:MAG: alcohol dehydrogenase catalytic domain-containing protein [Nitrospinota bacterium]|nr:alcohol dehydrogenase catalytic domain-containing protein [Nitrospinota bacterium]